MTLKHFFLLICFLWLVEPLAATSTLAKPGCKDTCGIVTIPYPFGIGPGCFLNEWYEVLCHDDRPYLHKYNGHDFRGEVLDVSLDNSTITINGYDSAINVCEDEGIWLGGNMSGSPLFYRNNNKVIVVGCGNVMLFADQTTIGGCTTTCDQYRKVNDCNGINCCEIFLPFTNQNYYLNFSNSVTRSNSCASVILAEQSWYPTNSTSFSDPSEILVGVSIPVVLEWMIPKMALPELQSNTNCYPGEKYVFFCKCPECTEGNPYIPNGCQGRSKKPECVSTANSRKSLILFVFCGTSFGILFLVTIGFLLYKSINKRRERKLREKYFKQNGGLLLQQQLSVDENIYDKVRFFTSRELDKATDYFSENRVLGHGGQGTVYKGMLVDGKIVAVKKSKLADKNQVKHFINEVVVLSQINHRNVVKLLGCCLETNIPLLVYEFIPNGNLFDLIHNEKDEFLMSWDMRVRIAIEVAGALAYMHSATSISIYHRDIKSKNILLDEKYVAKVSDFGISRHITIDQTHLTTLVKGTFGYLDPEYFRSNKFTEKSDVYSFGVVLAELLTRQKPLSSIHTVEENFLSLAARFLISMEEDHLDMILDTQILETTSNEQVTAVAILAQRCLNLDGKKRPTMKEVAMELESIKMSHMPSTSQTNFEGESSSGVGLVSFSGCNLSSTTASDLAR